MPTWGARFQGFGDGRDRTGCVGRYVEDDAADAGVEHLRPDLFGDGVRAAEDGPLTTLRRNLIDGRLLVHDDRDEHAGFEVRRVTSDVLAAFFIWAKKSKINVAMQVGFRQAKTSPTINQDQAHGKEGRAGSFATGPSGSAG